MNNSATDSSNKKKHRSLTLNNIPGKVIGNTLDLLYMGINTVMTV
jgi:hypothetical protein